MLNLQGIGKLIQNNSTKFKKLMILACLCVFLTSCAKKESIDDYRSVNETIEDIKSTDQDSKNGDISNSGFSTDSKIIDENLIYYPLDSHFYNGNSIEYLEKLTDSNMKFEVLDAYTSKELADGGVYFTKSKMIQDAIKLNAEENGEKYSFLFVKVRVTNLSDKDIEMYFNTYSFYARVNDSYGEKFGYADKKVVPLGVTMLDFDKSTNSESLFYVKDLSAKESIITTMAIVVPDKYISEEIYVKLSIDLLGMADPKKGNDVNVPNDSPNLKFLKINIK